MKTRSRDSARLGLWVFASVCTLGSLSPGAALAASSDMGVGGSAGEFVDADAFLPASMEQVVTLFSAFQMIEHGKIWMSGNTT
ncbi:hypothetical protein ACEWPM_016990 [Roseovarius sp. S4756]|uniref:hypothetical protein n=1 Tax=Roseovarius maritimus TaxID=3342637 RepID=UPI00372CBCE6